MRCPKCERAMKPVTFDGIEIDRCVGCGGLWFDLREHDRLADRPNASSLDTGRPAEGELRDEQRDIDCPRCETPTVKLAFPEQPHIHYEGCATCGGAFLDAGEFTDLAEKSLAERLSQLFAPIRQRLAVRRKSEP